MENRTAILENNLNTKHATTYNLATGLQSIYLREMKTYVPKNTWTSMFTAALFVILPNWKQLLPLSKVEQRIKQRYCYHATVLSNKKKQTTDKYKLG